MIKTLFKVTLALSLALICSHAFADGSAGSINFPSTGMDPSSNDQSRYYLGMIFGQVGNVLNGSSNNQILGTMFAELNRALLILGTIIFTYVYGKGVLDTAAHGEFLGKQANSLWVPLRSVGGLALMIPKASTGYCVIQVFMMWVVLQGVGAADMIWNTLSHKILNNHQGASANASAVVSASLANQLVPQIQNVFSSLVCGYAVQKSQNSGALSADFSSSNNTNSYDINYYAQPGEKPISCGHIRWSSQCPKNISAANCNQLLADQKQSIKNIITDLQPIASFYVSDSYRFCNQRDANGNCIAPAFPQSLTDAGNNGTVGNHVYNFVNKVNFPQNESLNYVSGLAGDKASQRNNDPSQHAGNHMVDDGWMYAGSYIYQLAKVSNANGTVPTFQATTASFNSMSKYFPKGSTYPDPIQSASKYTQNLPSDNAPSSTSSNPDKKRLEAIFGTMGGITSAMFAGVGVGAAMSGAAWATPVAIALTGITAGFTAILDLIIKGSGPLQAILYLQTLGYVILATMAIAFGTMIGLMFAQSLAANVMNCMQPVGFAAADVASYLNYVLMATFTGLFAIGIFLAVYLPLLPFIYFTFGVLSWLVAVLETMIAAPIVALGIIHPEGHDFWGKAEPAVMLTVNVFLRPSLMLFGLMAGILLGYVFVDIITVGFGSALFNMQDKGAAMGNPIQAMAVMALYTFMIVVGYTQCFKLINELGNRILSWLGFQGQLGLNSDDATGQMKQNASTIGSTGQQAGRDLESKLRDKAGSQKRSEDNAKKTGLEAAGNSSAGNGGGNSPLTPEQMRGLPSG